jgi:hypothetical protein
VHDIPNNADPQAVAITKAEAYSAINKVPLFAASSKSKVTGN